jgi:ABC-type spermidine/putrescine transport system permease subunit I
VNNALLALGFINEPVKFMFTHLGVTIGLLHFGLPVAILSLVGVIETVDRSLEEAARGLGASPLQTFLRITLPLTMPGIAAASMLVFSSAVAAFVIPALMGGPSLIVLPTLIYQQMMDTLEWGFGAAGSTILLVVALGLFFIYQRLLALARGLGQMA